MFHISRHTVSKYIEGDAEKLASPDKIDKINFDTNRNEIIELLKKYTVYEAYPKAIKLGYTGKRTQFYKKCKELFEECNLPRLIKSTHGENIIPQKINHHYIKRTDIFRYLWHGDNHFTENEIKQINDRYTIIEELNDLIKDFRKLFANKSIIELCLFITNNKDSAYSQIRSFIKSVLKDIEPISNAVIKEYNNGFVEGTNNKLKMIKRQSYGRSKLELLRAKIILQSFLVN